MSNTKSKDDIIKLIEKISNNFKNIISKEEIEKYDEINWGNNGIGDRFARKLFNYTAIRKNSYTIYSENEETIDKNEIKEFSKKTTKISGIIGIKIHSLKNTDIIYRPIKNNIKKFYKNKPCVVCGTTSTFIDHKNDLYNDPKVLNIKTQTIDDFQPLCNHCNLQKRQICKKEKETKILYSAKNIPMLKVFGDFEWENIILDETNKDNKKNMFWYDPIKFCERINDKYNKKIEELNKIIENLKINQ